MKLFGTGYCSRKLSQKITKNRLKPPAVGGSAPRPSPWYVWLKLVYSTRFLLLIFLLINFGFEPLPLAKSWLSAELGPSFWSSILRYLCPTKISLSKISLTSSHVICSLPPQSNILATPVNRTQCCQRFATAATFLWK